MTGPEHYREAEKLLESVTSSRSYIYDGTEVPTIIAAAQAHAGLALAAATALGVGSDDPPPEDAAAWWRAAGTRDPRPGRSEEDVDDA